MFKSCICNGRSCLPIRPYSAQKFLYGRVCANMNRNFIFHRVQSILWTFVYMMCVLQKQSESPYSRTSPYGHLSNTDTSLLRTVNLVAGKCPNILCKNNLYTDNGQAWTTDTKSRPQRLTSFITDTPMMTVLIQHDAMRDRHTKNVNHETSEVVLKREIQSELSVTNL